MATYRARWLCPVAHVMKYRDFTKKVQAEAFRDLPRAGAVVVRIDRFDDRKVTA